MNGNGPGPKFWTILKRTMLVLAALSVVAAIVLYFTLTGLRKTFFPICSLIIGANFLFVYFFVRLNDGRRPGSSRDFEARLREKERKRGKSK